MRTLLSLGLAGAAFFLLGCPSAPCEGSNCSGGGNYKEPLCRQWAQTRFGDVFGSCQGVTQRIFELGTDGCDQKVAGCSEADKAALATVLQCYNQLLSAPCRDGEEVPFQKALFACNQAFEQTSSDPCRQSLNAGALNPQGLLFVRRPDADGGGALELIAVADEDSFALAWSPLQRGLVERWSVQSENALGEPLPEVAISPSSVTVHNEYDAGIGVKKSFFVLGLDSNDQVARGLAEVPDAGRIDAGSCRGPLDCPIDRVCDLGQCRVQGCTSTSICPSGYACETSGSKTCVRQFGSDGGVDAGAPDGGALSAARPLVSKKVSVATGLPKFSEERAFSTFSPRGRGDIVAIDSARQVIALEQEGQLFAHSTQNRGKSFEIGQIDTIGTGVRLAYVSSTRTLFACYNAGMGVRVRRSHDLGRSWGQPTDVVDLSKPPPSDGGVAERIYDCDLAPWLDGTVMVVTVEGDRLTVRTVNGGLSVEGPDLAFVSSPADGGLDVANPEHPAIATLPEDRLVHIGFTGTRTLAGGNADTEPYGVFRGPTTGGVFKFAGNMTYLGISKPFSLLKQDYVTLAIDPRTRRPIAAFTSEEPDRLGSIHTAVHVAMMVPPSERWGMRGDLSVFVTKLQSEDYHLFPERAAGEKWNAFSPALAVTPAGKIYLSFVAGPERAASGASDYHGYLVPFEFERRSAELNAQGWFAPPANRTGPTRVVDPRAGILNPSWSSLAADSQISVYMTYTEGVGDNADIPRAPVVVTRP